MTLRQPGLTRHSAVLGRCRYYAHFTDEEAEAQTGNLTSDQELVKCRIVIRMLGFQPFHSIILFISVSSGLSRAPGT